MIGTSVWVGGVPTDRGDEGGFGPDDHVGVVEHGLEAHFLEVEEVAFVGVVAAFPRVGVVLDGGNFEGVVLRGVVPVIVGNDAVDNLGKKEDDVDGECDFVEEDVCPKAVGVGGFGAAEMVAAPVAEEGLGEDHHECDAPDAEEVRNLDENFVIV